MNFDDNVASTLFSDRFTFPTDTAFIPMSNPILESTHLPHFSRIEAAHVAPAIDQLIEENLSLIETLTQSEAGCDWDTLVEPLSLAEDRLNRAFSPVGHLNAVMNSEALREAYNAVLPRLSAYGTEIGQNEKLYQAYRSIAESAEFSALDPAQQRIITQALRDFRLSGVGLPTEQKARFKALVQRLTSLGSQFQDHVLDATQGWFCHLTDPSRLSGLPASAKLMAEEAARAKGLSGWVFTLEFPSYTAVMTHADDRALRAELYEAYATRASDQGPQAGQFDNSALMEEILALRHEEAQILGYANYAELSLATKMAPSAEAVEAFLTDLADRSLESARQDLAALKAFARETLGLEALEAHDLSYASEKLRESRYSISQEALRPYFPAHQVLAGLFEIIHRLYGVTLRRVAGIDVWHPDVTYYEIVDDRGPRAGFYLDLYARPNKRGGAWMDECVARRSRGGQVQLPVAFLTCNFTPPLEGQPALLRHEEVETLFHEFGHGLHHMLTRVDHLGVSGIRGVAWDAVELPSQFMENFCWQPETLQLISAHFESGEPLPAELLDRLLAARNFQSGLQMLRQIEFALFDFRLHRDYDPAFGGRIAETLAAVRARVAVLTPPAYHRFPHSFSHIFAGGYAAGYYSYKWAEVLSSDAFSLFEERGILDPATGQAFLKAILERGGSADAMELFVAFRGRPPSIEPLLRHSGLSQAA